MAAICGKGWLSRIAAFRLSGISRTDRLPPLRRGVYWSVAAVGAVSACAVGQAVHLRTSYKSPPDPEGPLDGHAGQRFSGRQLRILFVGDSTCVGVGASVAAPLQAACAERLAALRRMPVVWRTVGGTGLDTRELHRLVRESVLVERSFDYAVVLVGVNDGKKLLEGRFPSVFQADLRALCDSLREVAPQIVVPRIPGYLSAPLMQLWPMRYFVGHYFGKYEAQKEVVALTDVVESPTPPEFRLLPLKSLHMWSEDGVHPSGAGYTLFGEWLGAFLARIEDSTASE